MDVRRSPCLYIKYNHSKGPCAKTNGIISPNGLCVLKFETNTSYYLVAQRMCSANMPLRRRNIKKTSSKNLRAATYALSVRCPSAIAV